LALQVSMYPQLYWYNPREDFFFFGAGIAPQGEWTISFRDFFQRKRKTSLWDPFPSMYRFSPRVVMTKKGPIPLLRAGGSSFLHTPSLQSWKTTVDHALSLIDQRVLQKVVLARMTTVEASIQLGTPQPMGISFALLWDEEHIFLGNTPETLFERKGALLSTEALAGTKTLAIASKELLSSKKDREEFFFVRDTIIEKLSPYCKKITYDIEPKIKKTKTLQHLWTPITAHLSKDISDEFLLALLHPTPAVGGLPSETAQNFIYAHESFDRGLYAAPIGIQKENFSHFIVAIRSALQKEKKMHLFAGTGIVALSHSELEWEELNGKIDRSVQ